MFPVGFVSGNFVSTPVLDKNGKFMKFQTAWPGERIYQMPFAGFAISIKVFMEVMIFIKVIHQLSKILQIFLNCRKLPQ